ncbi:hypothetical protein J3E71DRAFT_338816 [Bipolaris maydis]|nr:hypothetical protein J3E71DRAFT_338816 [Bipolaris maydis]
MRLATTATAVTATAVLPILLLLLVLLPNCHTIYNAARAHVMLDSAPYAPDPGTRLALMRLLALLGAM